MIKNGISRKKRKKLRAGEKGLSWDYQNPDGRVISDKETIKALQQTGNPTCLGRSLHISGPKESLTGNR